jgi:hypothetical protein
MAKRLVSAEPNALIQAANSKGIMSLLAINEKTGVDRKTLKLINEGAPVKETTIKKIADKLRVPITHLLSQRQTETLQPNSDGSSRRLYELALQPLNAILLKEMLEQVSLPNGIVWSLNLDDVSAELESQLLKFESIVQEWLLLINGWDSWADKQRDLKTQLAKVRISTDVENRIQELASVGLKIFGKSYIRWTVEDSRGPYGDFHNAIEYRSICIGAIAVESKKQTTSKINIDPGEEPPRLFEDQPLHINDVYVDGILVWSRPKSPPFDKNGIPNFD